MIDGLQLVATLLVASVVVYVFVRFKRNVPVPVPVPVRAAIAPTRVESSSVAAPAVVDKHAQMLKMVNKCTHYKCMAQTNAKQKKKRVFFFLTFPFRPRHSTQWCARSA
jgi:hypothetical protein